MEKMRPSLVTILIVSLLVVDILNVQAKPGKYPEDDDEDEIVEETEPVEDVSESTVGNSSLDDSWEKEAKKECEENQNSSNEQQITNQQMESPTPGRTNSLGGSISLQALPKRDVDGRSGSPIINISYQIDANACNYEPCDNRGSSEKREPSTTPEPTTTTTAATTRETFETGQPTHSRHSYRSLHSYE